MPWTARFDLARQRFGGRSVTGIVDDNGETVASQPLRHRRTDAARGAGDDRNLATLLGHSRSPHRLLRDISLAGEEIDLFPSG
jgi:hypothetical protein